VEDVAPDTWAAAYSAKKIEHERRRRTMNDLRRNGYAKSYFPGWLHFFLIAVCFGSVF